MMYNQADYREPWMTDDQWRCACVAAEYKCGFHHLTNLRKWGNGIAIDEPQEVATYDFSGLTRLVVLAHDETVRVGLKVVTSTETYDGHEYEKSELVISFHPRNRPVDGDRMSSRHPALEDHVSAIRAERSQS